MKKFLLLLGTLFLFSLGTFVAQAQTSSSEESVKAKINYKKHTVIDFSDMLIKGELKKPTGSLVLKRAHVKFQGLIQLKQNFDGELSESIDKIAE